MTIPSDREAQSTLLFQRVRDYALRNRPEAEMPPIELSGFRKQMDIVEANIAKYSNEFIDRLCEATDHNSSPAPETILMKVLYESENTEGYDFQRDNLSTSKSSPIYAHEVLGGLLTYTRPSGPSTSHGPLTTEQVTALTTVTARLQDAKHATSEQDTHDLYSNHDYARWIPVTLLLNNTVITDNALARFIIDHPRQAEHIAGTILQRQSIDMELLHSAITTEALSLNEGII